MTYARLVLGLCDRFHKLPSEVLAEDAGLLRLIELERLAATDGAPVPHAPYP